MDKAEAMTCLQLVEEAEKSINRPDQALWFDRLEASYTEIESAARWFIHNGEASSAFALSASLWWYWYSRGRMQLGERLLDELLAKTSSRDVATPRARAIYARGELAFRQGHNDQARAYFEEAERATRDDAAWDVRNRALCGLGRVALRDHDFATVQRVAVEARQLARDHADKNLEWLPLHMQAAAARMLGDHAKARALYRESIALARELEMPSRVMTELHNLGYVDLHDGKLAEARADFREALLLAQESRDELTLRYSILDGAIVALADRRIDDATRLLGAAEAHFEEAGAVPDPDDQVEMDDAIAEVRRQLEPSRLTASWNDGARLSMGAAVEQALSSLST